MSLKITFKFYCVNEQFVHGTVIDNFLSEPYYISPRYIEIFRRVFREYFQNCGIPQITYTDQSHLVTILMNKSSRYLIEFVEDVEDCIYNSDIYNDRIMTSGDLKFSFDMIDFEEF